MYMKLSLRLTMLSIFCFSYLLFFIGILNYWNPNNVTLSGVLGNYNNKSYFFFLVVIVMGISGIIYECTFNDIFSLLFTVIVCISLLCLTWISEDYSSSFRNKSHVIIAAIIFITALLYEFYHASMTCDKYLWLLLLLSLAMFAKIVIQYLTFLKAGVFPSIIFEELTIVFILFLVFLRRGNI